MQDPDSDHITDMNAWSTKATLDIIGVAGLGCDFDTLKDSDDSLAKTYDHVLEPTFGKLFIFAMMGLGLGSLVKFFPGNVDMELTTSGKSRNRWEKTLRIFSLS